MEPERFFCWDAGVHFSQQNSYHLGYAIATSEKSCVLGNVSNGLVAGLSFDPATNQKGVFINRWMNLTIINLGWSVGYETRSRNSWCFIEPQIGLGLQRFRITYGYHIPFFLNARTDTGGHTLSLAYALAIQHR